jgi:hypothetical protein
MGLRLNKEIKIDVCDNINLKYGSVNKNDPQIIYVSGKMWISPSYEGDFETPINIIHSNFKKELTKSLRDSSIFESKHILDFDINPLTMTKDKKSFFSISFYVRQKPEKIINLNNIKHLISSKFGYLFRDLERDLIDNEFKVSKTK